MDLNPDERRSLAEAAGMNERFLYQCLTGRRNMDPRLVVRLEQLSDGRVRRWQVRRDWSEVWPELVGAAGAPEVRAAAV